MIDIEMQVTRVPTEIFSDLKHFIEERLYKRDADIIYKGHIPQCGFILKEGEITLRTSKNKYFKLTEGSLIGVKELMNCRPFKFDANIKSDSIVYILDRSTIVEILKSNNKTLSKLFHAEVG